MLRLVGFVVYEINKCKDIVSEQMCVISNINTLMNYIKEDMRFMKLEIIICYKQACISDIRTVRYETYKNATNIVCWYINDDPTSLTINNIKYPCDKKTYEAEGGALITCLILFLFILILLYYDYKQKDGCYLPSWYTYYTDKIFGNDNNDEKIIYDDDKLYQSGIQIN